MTEELKPCPFCGGKAYIEYGFNYDYDGGDSWYVYSADVSCDCGCTLHVDNVRPKEYVSEEHKVDFAITAWNRRAQASECRNVRPDRNSFKCSECGGAWYGVGGNAIARPYPKHCPNCGRKVVDE